MPHHSLSAARPTGPPREAAAPAAQLDSATMLRVVITVEGGVATVVGKTAGVEVVVIDANYGVEEPVTVTVSPAAEEIPIWDLAAPIAEAGALPERGTDTARRLVELARRRPGDGLADAIVAALECSYCRDKGWFVVLTSGPPREGDLDIRGCDDCGRLTDKQARELSEAQEALRSAVARHAAVHARLKQVRHGE